MIPADHGHPRNQYLTPTAPVKPIEDKKTAPDGLQSKNGIFSPVIFLVTSDTRHAPNPIWSAANKAMARRRPGIGAIKKDVRVKVRWLEWNFGDKLTPLAGEICC
jgi:hypothetical protein